MMEDNNEIVEKSAIIGETVEDETDANKLFSGKLFGGDRNEPKREIEPEFDQDISKIGKLEITDEDDFKIDSSSDKYSSSCLRRGVCIILENDMFHTNLGLSKRKGSSVDRQLMMETFTKLQFEVRIYSNLTVKDIYNTMEKVSLEDHSDRDMFAVVVLTHGNEGILYGYDHSYPTHKIWEFFTADKCPTLAGKPKLFFLQACQGNKMDSGASVGMKRTSTDSFASYRTPLYSDFLLAHSTVTGYYSWRNTVQGSWFIQVLGRALIANNKTEDVVTILTKVSKVVALDYESNSSRPEYNNKKQIPFIYSTLINKLYLKPK